MHDRNTVLEAGQRTAETKLNVSNTYVIRCMWERGKIPAYWSKEPLPTTFYQTTPWV